MASSGEKIHYRLRPAKSVERKMMCDVFRKLSAFGRIESYGYIGFGSFYFSDFILVHKSLGITNMISIESEDAFEKQARFLFNLPYKCIQVEFGKCNDVLPKLPWNMRSIVWLDYDSVLTSEVLADVQTACSKALGGSVLVISVNAQPDSYKDNRVQILKNNVGEDAVPIDIEDSDLAGWGKARVCQRIINNKIKEVLQDRNYGRPSGSKIVYRQLFYFCYADGAKMLTVGGLLYDEGQEPMVASCEFENLAFVKTGDEPYFIEVPRLTYREIRHLDSQLPHRSGEEMDSPVPESDVEKYRQIYRYFPTFTEAEI